jgi:hypothetical protein
MEKEALAALNAASRLRFINMTAPMANSKYDFILAGLFKKSSRENYCPQKRMRINFKS